MKDSFSERVRCALRSYKDRYELTNRELSKIIWKSDGETYSERTIRHYLANDQPGVDRSRLAVAVIESIPSVRSAVNAQ